MATVVEETKRLLRELIPDVEDLVRAVKWLRGFLVVGIVAVLVVGLFIWRFVDQSNCNTNRTKALSGPSAERVNLLYDALSAGFSVTKLKPADRAAAIRELSADRATYGLIPADDLLAKQTDAQLLTLLDVIRGLAVNETYKQQADKHPVCSLWGL